MMKKDVAVTLTNGTVAQSKQDAPYSEESLNLIIHMADILLAFIKITLESEIAIKKFFQNQSSKYLSSTMLQQIDTTKQSGLLNLLNIAQILDPEAHYLKPTVNMTEDTEKLMTWEINNRANGVYYMDKNKKYTIRDIIYMNDLVLLEMLNAYQLPYNSSGRFKLEKQIPELINYVKPENCYDVARNNIEAGKFYFLENIMIYVNQWIYPALQIIARVVLSLNHYKICIGKTVNNTLLSQQNTLTVLTALKDKVLSLNELYKKISQRYPMLETVESQLKSYFLPTNDDISIRPYSLTPDTNKLNPLTKEFITIMKLQVSTFTSCQQQIRKIVAHLEPLLEKSEFKGAVEFTSYLLNAIGLSSQKLQNFIELMPSYINACDTLQNFTKPETKENKVLMALKPDEQRLSNKRFGFLTNITKTSKQKNGTSIKKVTSDQSHSQKM